MGYISIIIFECETCSSIQYKLGVENDASTGIYHVGRGSYPNQDGIVQLDAAIMRGSDFSIGAVCALDG